MFDRQITLNQRIATIDAMIMKDVHWCEYYRMTMPLPGRYDEYREQLCFHMARRRWLLRRLLRVQLREFNGKKYKSPNY